MKDVLVGDVWLLSGQSNMQWAVSQAVNAKAEIAAADCPLFAMTASRSPPPTRRSIVSSRRARSRRRRKPACQFSAGVFEDLTALAVLDGKFKPAAAKVDCNAVLIDADASAGEVRYAWANSPKATLFNGDGLSASPFRTAMNP